MRLKKSVALLFSALLASAFVPIVTHAQQKSTIRFTAGNDNAAVEGTIRQCLS